MFIVERGPSHFFAKIEMEIRLNMTQFLGGRNIESWSSLVKLWSILANNSEILCSFNATSGLLLGVIPIPGPLWTGNLYQIQTSILALGL